MSADDFTHLDEQGRPRMIDVGAKDATDRTAVAEGDIRMAPETAATIEAGGARKGNVLLVAEIAGITAAKRTSELIPLCHPLPITSIEVALRVDRELPGVRARATVRVRDRTGVEMEALTAVSIALLTVYDMCKSLDRGMRIGDIRLLRKEGGRSGAWDLSGETR